MYFAMQCILYDLRDKVRLKLARKVKILSVTSLDSHCSRKHIIQAFCYSLVTQLSFLELRTNYVCLDRVL